MASTAGSKTPAVAMLSRAAVDFTVHEYHHDPANHAFGLETVEALGIPARRVFKTLIAELPGQRARHVCAVVPVTGQLDLKALAQVCGAKKAGMTDPATAERLTGYVVGGISPLGQKRRLPVYLDESAREQSTILVSGGRRGFSVELSADDLLRVVNGSFAALSIPRPGS